MTNLSMSFSRRRPTREVGVGGVGIGGKNPIRIQSMTTSDTRDVQGTIEQAMRLADSGCEIVRVTVQGKKEAESCESIKNGLLSRGYSIPLVADIHFYPPAALWVAPFVDKVRINPGNYVDRRATFRAIEYDDAAYTREIEKIEEGFAPLVEVCKRLNKAIRIGTNHGSLSDRIMNRFGDSPKGMVESALEFARICRKYDFHNFLFSMKSSNPVVMIQAYRLLVEEMERVGWDYPLHLGVTEAGEGEEGRVKSAIGIGTLLYDGIGDTIRVSLTEDPWQEIDPCQRIVSYFEQKEGVGFGALPNQTRKSVPLAQYKKPLHRDGTALLKVAPEEWLFPSFLADLGCKQGERTLDTPDLIWIDSLPSGSESIAASLIAAGVGLLSPEPIEGGLLLSKTALDRPYVLFTETGEIPPGPQPEFVLFHPSAEPVRAIRRLSGQPNSAIPLLIACSYSCTLEDLPIHAAAELGACLSDRLAEGIALLSPHPLPIRRRLSFTILQAARMRTTKTDFISCPGCGRTLFDLQETSRRIREKTAHLPGVKIAIMGCIVNGPGEMADADFGYVGSKTNLIDLYVGKTCVEKNIDSMQADDKLIELIKAYGKWKEPYETKI